MRVRLRTPLIATAALTAAVAVYIGITLPRAALRLDVAPPPTHVIGAYHVHTTRSDGSGTIPDIAAAARRAGLQFVILSDHGDATRQPDAPSYIDDVLVIDAVEINSREGHIVALGIDGAAPYPLAGPARAVFEDIHRLGGVAIAAHPDSPKASLRWQGMMNQGFDGIEWLNADSEWRDESPTQLLTTTARSLLRTPESIVSLFSRPERTLQRWDNAARGRAVFGLAATDAHARIGWREDEEPRQRTAFERPSYESLFRTLGQTVILDGPPTRDPAHDAARLIRAIRTGQSYSVIRALADPAALSFSAERGGVASPMGARLEAGAPVTFRAEVAGAPGSRVTLMRNGRRLESGSGRVTAQQVSDPGVYRVEVLLPDSPFPWIVSNPIVITPPDGPSPALAPPPASSTEAIALPVSGPRWSVEADPQSVAFRQGSDEGVGLQYQLAAGIARGQYAALVIGEHGTSGIDQVSFLGRASRPMRLSVQLRLPTGRDGERWVQSVYLDQTPRPVVLRMQDFEPVGIVTSRRPNGTPLHSLLFVVDTVNTLPGTSGSFWLSDLNLRLDRLTQ